VVADVLQPQQFEKEKPYYPLDVKSEQPSMTRTVLGRCNSSILDWHKSFFDTGAEEGLFILVVLY
jgi:hypothetical protein